LTKSVTFTATAMPILLLVGILLIILMILSFTLAPAEGVLESVVGELVGEDINPEDTGMTLPPPAIFSKPWAKWVALATCLPLGLAMLAISVMFIVSGSAKLKDIRGLDVELAQLK
jgi:hypothetical protein